MSTGNSAKNLEKVTRQLFLGAFAILCCNTLQKYFAQVKYFKFLFHQILIAKIIILETIS